ncbi:hypothetical protein Bca4012_079882 [Brassica carinata]
MATRKKPLATSYEGSLPLESLLHIPIPIARAQSCIGIWWNGESSKSSSGDNDDHIQSGGR